MTRGRLAMLFPMTGARGGKHERSLVFFSVS